jgi:hypothetical protein
VARLESASQFCIRVRIPKKIELLAVIQSIAIFTPFRSPWRAALVGILHQEKNPKDSCHWESGLSAERIQGALRGWLCDVLPGDYCRMSPYHKDLALILDSFGINGDLRLPAYNQIQQLKYTCDKTLRI